jgi:hypothetical protein
MGVNVKKVANCVDSAKLNTTTIYQQKWATGYIAKGKQRDCFTRAVLVKGQKNLLSEHMLTQN